MGAVRLAEDIRDEEMRAWYDAWDGNGWDLEEAFNAGRKAEREACEQIAIQVLAEAGNDNSRCGAAGDIAERIRERGR